MIKEMSHQELLSEFPSIRIAESTGQVVCITQAILAKAFRGEFAC